MELVLLTALGVGGATVLGSVIGFAFQKMTHKFSDLVLAFAAGVMLAAAVLGLIIPSVEYGNLVITVAGIFAGALSLNLIDRLVPHMHHLVGPDSEEHHGNANLDKVLLFVSAIAIHNLPEGIAAGVSFGSGNNAEALLIAGGIALHSIADQPSHLLYAISFHGDIAALCHIIYQHNLISIGANLGDDSLFRRDWLQLCGHLGAIFAVIQEALLGN